MKSFTHRLVRVLFRIAALCSLVASYEVRSVNTAWGVVRGELVHPDGADLAPVTQFLGVPYGVAPSGQFRFNMAISAAKWTHLPKEARKLAPACIQTQLPELSETRSYEVRSVNTAWGVVRGELVHPDGADLAPVTQFLGVPYGVAPSGQFRFNMAISAAKWTHLPKEARKLAPACIQTQLPELSETRLRFDS
ncbi:hypothetical protein COOONC_12790 [Cooperia oncophora]